MISAYDLFLKQYHNGKRYPNDPQVTKEILDLMKATPEPAFKAAFFTIGQMILDNDPVINFIGHMGVYGYEYMTRLAEADLTKEQPNDSV